ncbi:MAG: nicotinate-nucleotide adenylyltransferase [Synergistaceae bacterium]|nr:nicotinate-nucleotide adenylyltransferase [Candidatus Equadaptatus faecalis]
MKAAGNALKIGIMGGTFNPVHYGHLRAAEEARERLLLEKVIFIPAGNPPHKSENLASAEDRYNMTRLAVEDCPYFSVSRIETDRQGKSYTFETLETLKKNPEYAKAELYFITGFDAVLDIINWRLPEAIASLCRIVAVSRTGYTQDKISLLPENIRKTVILLEMPLLEISGTELRRRVTDGKSIKYLVPPSVEKYIAEKGLYV